jgi:formyltetrahydrofolate deformylase
LSNAYILTLSCPDRSGIVHAVTGFLAAIGANITEAAQYNDQTTGLFFMRTRFDCAATETGASLREGFGALANTMQMNWELHSATARLPTVIMVSKLGHCLNDLLFRHRSNFMHQSHRLEPPRFLPIGSVAQHPLPPHSCHARHQGPS